ncbi:putative F420-0 ABC transporter substrate-binding protein [Cellulosimicrobium sp. BIT-GX5]|uniref:Putative F420-0 ABC transporter substrate-binding protein n=1 Tax=Cellulosimicrobium composti TaxID=2672572 RepID=A0A6N7ZLI5_9MICO|nr:putative F420-0 ABC transporter substrate-binding protein [Cellulosimicrobium composti]MTG90375.1 putative F420-0 ABC transporter substrate-binding protein [Cellulosimicrobium composti]
MPSARTAPRRPHGLLALPAALALALAACSSGTAPGGTSTPDGDDPASATVPARTTYPLTVEDCGVEVTFDAAPERVVTIKSSTTEMLLALGLGDRIVATAFPDGPVPPALADAAADVPAVAEPMSDKVPGAEAVLDAEPDLVYAGWESNLTADGAGDRDTLARLGVATYVSPAACKAPEHMPDPLTFEHVFAEITEVGTIFDAQDAAAALVAEQRATLDGVVRDERGLTALWYSSGDDIPYVGAGIGAPQMILDAVGLENVAGDVHDTWTSYAWEEAIAADPDVLVLVDAAWNTADAKIERLESNPATAEMTAVREGRYLTIPFPATEAGVRTVDAVVDLAAQLEALDL